MFFWWSFSLLFSIRFLNSNNRATFLNTCLQWSWKPREILRGLASQRLQILHGQLCQRLQLLRGQTCQPPVPQGRLRGGLLAWAFVQGFAVLLVRVICWHVLFKLIAAVLGRNDFVMPCKWNLPAFSCYAEQTGGLLCQGLILLSTYHVFWRNRANPTANIVYLLRQQLKLPATREDASEIHMEILGSTAGGRPGGGWFEGSSLRGAVGFISLIWFGWFDVCLFLNCVGVGEGGVGWWVGGVCKKLAWWLASCQHVAQTAFGRGPLIFVVPSWLDLQKFSFWRALCFPDLLEWILCIWVERNRKLSWWCVYMYVYIYIFSFCVGSSSLWQEILQALWSSSLKWSRDGLSLRPRPLVNSTAGCFIYFFSSGWAKAAVLKNYDPKQPLKRKQLRKLTLVFAGQLILRRSPRDSVLLGFCGTWVKGPLKYFGEHDHTKDFLSAQTSF